MKGLSRKLLPGIGVLTLAAAFLSPAWAAETYPIDKGHSSIGFSVTHLMVSTVRGSFTDYEGTLQFDPADPAATKAEITIKADSINTNQADRDAHLRKPDFLDTANYPMIIFKSKSVKKEGNTYLITGDLTMRDVTKEITIPIFISGPVKSPFGKDVIGLTGQATINRQDFGVSWDKRMDQGGLVVSDDVILEINIEAAKEAVQETAPKAAAPEQK